MERDRQLNFADLAPALVTDDEPERRRLAQAHAKRAAWAMIAQAVEGALEVSGLAPADAAVLVRALGASRQAACLPHRRHLRTVPDQTPVPQPIRATAG